MNSTAKTIETLEKEALALSEGLTRIQAQVSVLKKTLLDTQKVVASEKNVEPVRQIRWSSEMVKMEKLEKVQASKLPNAGISLIPPNLQANFEHMMSLNLKPTIEPVILSYFTIYPDRLDTQDTLLPIPQWMSSFSEELKHFRTTFKLEKTPFLPTHAESLMPIVLKYLPHEQNAADFVSMYRLAMNTVSHAIQDQVRGKFNELDETGAIALTTTPIGRNPDDQDNVWKPVLFCYTAPLFYINTLVALPTNPNIHKDAKNRYPQWVENHTQPNGYNAAKPWPLDDSVPSDLLSAYGKSLISNFIKSMRYLNSDMRSKCVEQLLTLGDYYGSENRIQAFGDRIKYNPLIDEYIYGNLIADLVLSQMGNDYRVSVDNHKTNGSAPIQFINHPKFSPSMPVTSNDILYSDILKPVQKYQKDVLLQGAEGVEFEFYG